MDTQRGDRAVKTCYSRHTVAHICIPKDIQGWESSHSHRSEANVPGHSADLFAAASCLPPDRLLQEAAALVNAGS